MPKSQMTAAKAVAHFQEADNPRGLEVWIAADQAGGDHAYPVLPQITGWRSYPEAKG